MSETIEIDPIAFADEVEVAKIRCRVCAREDLADRVATIVEKVESAGRVIPDTYRYSWVRDILDREGRDPPSEDTVTRHLKRLLRGAAPCANGR